MRTKGGWVINYSCCMTVCVCDYVCVQKHKVCLEMHLRSSVTENSVSAGSDFTESCVRCLPAPCKKSVFPTLKCDELLSGRIHSVWEELFSDWVLSWCFTVCTDGSPTSMLRLASLHSPTATLTFFLSWDHRNIIWVQLQRFIYPFNIIFSQLLHKLWSFNACSCL